MKHFTRSSEDVADAMMAMMKHTGIRNQARIQLGRRAWIDHVETDHLIFESLQYMERDQRICCIKIETRGK
jgi:hypothetical protein